MSKYDYFLFDWDGTLVNSVDRWHSALKRSLIDNGCNLADKDVGADYRLFSDKAETLGVKNVESVINKAYFILEKHPETIQLNEYVAEMLSVLKSADKKLAIVTTSTHAQVNASAIRFGIKNYFDLIICADDVDNLKPHPEPVELAIKLLAGNKQRAIMIGDSSADIMAASYAGIGSILYFPKRYEVFSDKAELMNFCPTKVIVDFKDLIEN